MALSLSEPRLAVPNGGRYPPSRPVESGLSSAAYPQTQTARPVTQASDQSPGAPAIIAPATNLYSYNTGANQAEQPAAFRFVNRSRIGPIRYDFRVGRSRRQATGVPEK